MTRDERLMLAEQGAADPELMGAGVSAAVDLRDAEIAALRAALKNLTDKLGMWLTTADAGLPAVVRTIGDCAELHAAHRIARAALAQSGEAGE